LLWAGSILRCLINRDKNKPFTIFLFSLVNYLMAGQPFASTVEREIKIFAGLLWHVHQSTLPNYKPRNEDLVCFVFRSLQLNLLYRSPAQDLAILVLIEK